jgi:Protein of unknown function (DUF1579)
MKRSILIAIVAIAACAGAAVAKTPSQAAKPGAEQKELSFFAGTWTLQAVTKASPVTAAGKFTQTETNQWIPGGFFLISHLSQRAPAGDPLGSHRSATAIRGYDPNEKMYTFDAFHGLGVAEHYKGTVQGDTWTFTGTNKVNGQSFETRYTATKTSASSYTFKVEISSGGSWSTIMEGKATKIGAKAAKSK